MSAHEWYGVRPFPLVPAGANLECTPVPVPDIRSAFASLRERGDYLAAHDGGVFFPEHRYTGENYGPDRGVIHFQGVQRLRDGRHFVVSGGDSLEDVSHLFILRVGPEGRKSRRFGGNLRDSRDPDPEDKVVNVIGLRSVHWHPGGISVLGDVLAVPLEAGKRRAPSGGEPMARIVFMDLTDPMVPRSFPAKSEIACGTSKAGAVALTRLPNGRFLCGVWTDEKGGGLSCFVSRGSEGFEGFGGCHACPPWSYSATASEAPKEPRYQNINFVWEAAADGSPVHLYLIGTRNTSKGAPSVPGTDMVDLFEVHLPDWAVDNADFPVRGAPLAPELTYLGSRKLSAADEYCSLAAGGGVYVSPEGALALYGAFHWRISGTIRMSEFRSDRTRGVPSRERWVDLFEHNNLRGRRLSLVGRRWTSIPDYSKISVQGRGFDDRVSSARFWLPEGVTYRLYRDPGYHLSGSHRDYIDLIGTGAVVEIRDLTTIKKTFGDCVSSSRFLAPE